MDIITADGVEAEGISTDWPSTNIAKSRKGSPQLCAGKEEMSLYSVDCSNNKKKKITLFNLYNL